MLSFDLGSHSLPITTLSTLAQKYFDQGLNWMFGFNQDEALACFKEALVHDPNCAMAHWGCAYAAGPFYNMPWVDFSISEAQSCTAFCHEHLTKAQELKTGITSFEADIIQAAASRVQQPHAVTQIEFDKWDTDYAAALRKVHLAHPNDLVVIALLIEALITRTPWRLWDVYTNRPPVGTDTYEALALCQQAIAHCEASGRPQHPAILHLHIHVVEMSDSPEQALLSADRLEPLSPDAGHIHHMPGHIYVLCGQYDKAKACSEKAIIADRKYLAYAGPYNYYTTARCHDLHLMMYACMFLGQYAPAWAAAKEICATLTPDVINLPDKPFIASTMEGYFSVGMHVLIRFGKWQKIIDLPMPKDPELYVVSTAMHHYAKGVAHAALKNFAVAEQERIAFHASLKRIPKSRRFFNNTALEALAIGEKMLDGELEYHKGNHTKAYAHLRESVRLCDSLEYSEPWVWMHPPRHALGALLLAQGHYDEAEEVYRTDLGLNDKIQRCAQHRGNVWALHGLVECLHWRGETDELPEFEVLLREAMSKTDVPITSSCCCRTSIADTA